MLMAIFPICRDPLGIVQNLALTISMIIYKIYQQKTNTVKNIPLQVA